MEVLIQTNINVWILKHWLFPPVIEKDQNDKAVIGQSLSLTVWQIKSLSIPLLPRILEFCPIFPHCIEMKMILQVLKILASSKIMQKDSY